MAKLEKYSAGVVGALVVFFTALGALASLAQFVAKHAATLGGLGWLSFVGCATVLAMLLRLCFCGPGFGGERRTAAAVIGGSFALKLALVVYWRNFPQTADRLFLLQFVDSWVSGGGAALRQLSRDVFDYPLWTGRAWPFLYPVRVLFPQHFVFATQVLNCFLSTALVAGIFQLTRRFVARPLVPLALASASPAFIWSVLDYGYQFQGALLIVAALMLMRKILDGSPFGARVPVCMCSVALGVLFFVLHLQQGLDLIVAALLAASAAYAGMTRRSWRHGSRLAVFLVVIPLTMSMPMSRAADSYFRSCDEGHLSSSFIGHAALGWNLVTWGEYYGPVVALDKATPPEKKNAVMMGFIRDQIRGRPFDAFVKLPFVKIIKLFQLGAATGIEETFAEDNSPRWVALFRGTRLLFAPVVLALAALGAMRFFRNGDTERIAWGLLVIGLVVAYTFFSETSPRYSFYFQFVLLACAAEGLDIIALRRKK